VAQRTGEPHQTTEESGSYEEKRMTYRMVEVKKLTIKGKVEDREYPEPHVLQHQNAKREITGRHRIW
jgi:hypothetical protein